MNLLIIATFVSCILLSVNAAEYAQCDFPESGSVRGHLYFMEEGDIVFGHILLQVAGKHRRFPVHIHNGTCVEEFTPFDDPETPGSESYLGDFTATPEGIVLISDFETPDISLNSDNFIVGRSIVVQLPGKEGQVCCQVVPSTKDEYYNHSDEHDHHDHHEEEDDHHDDHEEDDDHHDDHEEEDDHHDDDDDKDVDLDEDHEHDDHKEDQKTDEEKDDKLDVEHDEEEEEDHDHDDDYNHITDGVQDHGSVSVEEEEQAGYNEINANYLYALLLKKYLGI